MSFLIRPFLFKEQFLRKYFAELVILLSAIIVSLPLFNADFVFYDDDIMVFNNPLLSKPFIEAIASAFSFSGIVHYHPLVNITYIIEKNLFGFDPSAFHITNIFLHSINSLLVYRLLLKFRFAGIYALTGALLFAVHPMHTESFAWVTERKDMLYAVFFFISLIYYIEFSSKGERKYLYLSIASFILSCFSKSMAVSLPLVLILIDHFILNKKNISYKTLMPYFFIALIIGIINLSSAFYILKLPAYSFIERLLLVCYSVMFYPVKLLFPFGLSVIYPYPGQLTIIHYLSMPVLAILAFVIFRLRNRKLIIFGSLFYLLCIIPVLPIIPFGISMTADRFTYISSLGILVAILYISSITFNKAAGSSRKSKGRLLFQTPRRKYHLTYIVLISLLVITSSFLTFSRSSKWINTEELMNDALKQNGSNYYAYFIMGNYYNAAGRFTESIRSYNSFIALNNTYQPAYFNLGNSCLSSGKYRDALTAYTNALNLDPADPLTFNNIGLAYEYLGRNDSAIISYKRSAMLGYEPAKNVLKYYGLKY